MERDELGTAGNGTVRRTYELTLGGRVIQVENRVFTTESIENIPPGWRARETYVVTGPDMLLERFELAEPGKDFTLYSELVLTRVKR